MLLFADLCILSVRIYDVYIIVYMYNTGIYDYYNYYYSRDACRAAGHGWMATKGWCHIKYQRAICVINKIEDNKIHKIQK